MKEHACINTHIPPRSSLDQLMCPKRCMRKASGRSSIELSTATKRIFWVTTEKRFSTCRTMHSCFVTLITLLTPSPRIVVFITLINPVFPQSVVIAERLSARHPNSAAHSRLAMYVPMYLCQSRFRNANYCVDNDVKMADTLTFIFPVPDGPRPDHGY